VWFGKFVETGIAGSEIGGIEKMKRPSERAVVLAEEMKERDSFMIPTAVFTPAPKKELFPDLV
jgi:hypothetical protein